MRVTMTQAWDRASEVLAGRQAMLATIAAATLWLPAVVRQGIGAALLGDTPAGAPASAGLVVALLGIVAAVIGLWGKLAIVAVASDPAVTPAVAYRVASARLPLMIGLALLVALVLALALVPLAVIAAPFASHVTTYDPTMMAAPMTMVPAGQRAFFSLYLLVIVVVFIWLVIRLTALTPVVVNEREGIGSFRRSFQVTQGHVWRLLGVLILFGIVIGVSTIAVQAVVGIVVRLIVGQHLALAALLTTLFTAAVTAVGNVVVLVFTTSFYLLRREAPALS